jgi:predicted phosphoribosyltransferase
MALFKDRRDGGRQLAHLLCARAPFHRGLVLALARGGVPVGFEIARALDLELDVLVVRKLGVPGCEELAMGAVVSGGFRVLDQDLVDAHGISESEIERAQAAARGEIDQQEQRYRSRGPRPLLTGRDLLLVDDGLATGASMEAAVNAVQVAEPSQVLVAVPVGSAVACSRLAVRVDDLVCWGALSDLQTIGRWYGDFAPVTTEEVQALLAEASVHRRAASAG